jgi:Fur family ferric uptake transcriptional regulator
VPEADEVDRILRNFERFLATRGLRLSTARRTIVDAVLRRRGHFPIDELVEDLKRLGIRGSKATVYRTLPLLIEAGILQRGVVTSETVSYETAVGHPHHDHLVCSACGHVVEFEFEAFEILQREVAARHGFRLDAHHHELIGTCPKCLESEKLGEVRPDLMGATDAV